MTALIHNGLVLNRQQTIIWINVGTLYWRIYVSLELSELKWYIYSAKPMTKISHIFK